MRDKGGNNIHNRQVYDGSEVAAMQDGIGYLWTSMIANDFGLRIEE